MRIKYWLFFLFFILLSISLIFAVKRLVVINKVDCSSQYGPCGREVEEIAFTAVGKNLFEAIDGLKKGLRENNLIDSFYFQYKLMDRLEVKVKIKKADYAVKDEVKNLIYLINSKGEIFISVQESNLPIIYTSEFSFKEGEKVENDYLVMLQVFSDINQLYKVKKANLLSDRMEISLEDNPLLIFPYGKEREVLVGSTRLIIEQLNSAVQKFKIEKGVDDLVVDLRYKNPVIR